MEQTTFSTLELIDRNVDQFGQPIARIKSASQWFIYHFQEKAKIFGAPFLENRVSTIDGFSNISPVAPNLDFMASILGGDKRLGHSVVYWPAECLFYYFDPIDNIYHPTTDEKLGDLMRGYMARCAIEVPKDVNVYHLFTTFRTDRIIKGIVERAKSILRASEDYFSATSPCERVRGIELHERLARVFVERLLKPKPNEVMLVAAAYERFAGLVKQRDMVPIKRSVFKELVTPVIRERFNAGLRNDLVVQGRYQQGWKDLGLNTEVVLE
jgi:hypothetical protein